MRPVNSVTGPAVASYEGEAAWQDRQTGEAITSTGRYSLLSYWGDLLIYVLLRKKI